MMDANCIDCNNRVVFRLPRPVAPPQGWEVQEVQGATGNLYRIARPPSNSRRAYYYWPWLPVRETREEAERDARPWPGDGNYVYGTVVEFPLGGYIWYQTGLKTRSIAEKRAQQAMAQIRAALGLSD